MKGYTDIEQSRKLFELGLNPETADMKYFILPDEDKETNIIPSCGFNIKTKELYDKTDMEYLPCWSLNALLESIPQYIRHYDKYDRSNKCYDLNLFRSYYHCCSYSYGPSLKMENHDSLCCFGEDNWVDAVVKTIYWLFEKGHLTKEEDKKEEVKEENPLIGMIEHPENIADSMFDENGWLEIRNGIKMDRYGNIAGGLKLK